MLDLCNELQSLPGAQSTDNTFSDIAVDFYEEIRWNLDQVGDILIPRVIESTTDQDVINYLIEFDRARIKLHTATYVHNRIAIGGIFPDVVNLLIQAHAVYNTLIKIW